MFFVKGIDELLARQARLEGGVCDCVAATLRYFAGARTFSGSSTRGPRGHQGVRHSATTSLGILINTSTITLPLNKDDGPHNVTR